MKEKHSETSCPGCSWKPQPEHTWYCLCGHSWNTFETGGICPGCKKAWDKTQCPACDSWSDHADWYSGLKNKLRQDLSELLHKPRKRKIKRKFSAFHFRLLHNISLIQRKKIKAPFLLFRIPPLKN